MLSGVIYGTTRMSLVVDVVRDAEAVPRRVDRHDRRLLPGGRVDILVMCAMDLILAFLIYLLTIIPMIMRPAPVEPETSYCEGALKKCFSVMVLRPHLLEHLHGSVRNARSRPFLILDSGTTVCTFLFETSAASDSTICSMKP
jgi:hypothetical protein